MWTTKYKPIEIIETSESNTNTAEFNKTLEFMKRYGIDNVRGGPFCQLDISHHKESIKAIISSIEDICYVCKKKGHFKKQCPLLTKRQTSAINEPRQKFKERLIELICKQTVQNITRN